MTDERDHIPAEEGPSQPARAVGDITLRRIEGMRRENDALRSQISRLLEQSERLHRAVNGFREDVRSEFSAVRADLNVLKSDVLHLENQNMSRHGEILRLMRKTEDLSDPLDDL